MSFYLLRLDIWDKMLLKHFIIPIIHGAHIKIHYSSSATYKLISSELGYCYKPSLFLFAFTFEPKYKHI